MGRGRERRCTANIARSESIARASRAWSRGSGRRRSSSRRPELVGPTVLRHGCRGRSVPGICVHGRQRAEPDPLPGDVAVGGGAAAAEAARACRKRRLQAVLEPGRVVVRVPERANRFVRT